MRLVETIDTKRLYWRRFGETNCVYAFAVGHAVRKEGPAHISEYLENCAHAGFILSFGITYDVATISSIRIIATSPHSGCIIESRPSHREMTCGPGTDYLREYS